MSVRLNVPTNSHDQAVAVTSRYPGRIVIGVTAKDFPDPADAISLIKSMQERDVLVSVGLGDGAADQWQRALAIALATHPFHLNQVLPAAGLSEYALSDSGAATRVNGLIRPAPNPKHVVVGTGPLSQSHLDQHVPVEVALDMLVEVGVTSVKLYPMDGCDRLEHLASVARAAAQRKMMVEPTGGLTPENLGSILEVCGSSGATDLMPHLYSSVKDPTTGELDLGRVKHAFDVIDDHLAAR